jgi:UDP-2,3-diacylglucosamine pyrophosphatase LpxH
LDGDIVDLLAMKHGLNWGKDEIAVLHKIFKLLNSGTRIFYLPGNHDDAVRQFVPCLISGIEVEHEIIHVTATGLKILVMHGDKFGITTKFLDTIGTFVYGWLLELNYFINIVLKFFGLKYFSLAGYLKQLSKKATSYVHDYKNAVKSYAIERGCDGAIVGHVHKAELSIENDFLYGNCGDWVESMTALVETDNGEIQSIRFVSPGVIVVLCPHGRS